MIIDAAFGHLRASVRCVADGAVSPPEDSAPTGAIVRAEVLRWLCINPTAHQYLDPRGISILCAHIQGLIDLRGADVPVRLSILNCRVPDGIILRDAMTKTIDLTGSKVSYVHARGAHIDGDFLAGSFDPDYYPFHRDFAMALRKVDPSDVRSDERTLLTGLDQIFECEDDLQVERACITGSLSLSNATIHSTRPGVAIRADNITVNGSVRLNHDFIVHDCVRFRNATIGGDFDCTGGTFRCAHDAAIDLHDANIKGDVLFCGNDDVAQQHSRYTFDAPGGLRVTQATIKGSMILKRVVAIAPCYVQQSNSQASSRQTNAGEQAGSPTEADTKTTGVKSATPGCLSNRALMLNGTVVSERLVFRQLQVQGILSLRNVRTSYFDDVPSPETGAPHIADDACTDDSVRVEPAFALWRPAQLRPGELILDGFEYKSIAHAGQRAGEDREAVERIEWLRLQRPARPERSRFQALLHELFGGPLTDVYYPQPYEQLARILFRLGRGDAARKVMMAKYRDSAESRWGGMRIWNWILFATIGNGYRTMYSLLWLLGLLLFGWLVFLIGTNSMRVGSGDVLAYVLSTEREREREFLRDEPGAKPIVVDDENPVNAQANDKVAGDQILSEGPPSETAYDSESDVEGSEIEYVTSNSPESQIDSTVAVLPGDHPIPTPIVAPVASPNSESVPREYPAFSPLMYSFDAMVPILDMRQVDYWTPGSRALFAYFWCHRILGAALVALLVGGISTTIARGAPQ